MTIAEYLDRLLGIKEAAAGRWDSISGMDREIYNSSYGWLLDNLDIKKGTFQSDEHLAEMMDRFLFAVVDIINNNQKYESRLTSFIGDLDKISAANKAFHGSWNKFNIETAGVTEIQKTVVNEIMNQYLGNGLNVNFAAPLRDSVFRNILAGANQNEVKQTLQEYIIGGGDQSGKLQRYLKQTAQMAVDSYSGAINQQLQKDFKFTGLIISGSLIATSSKQCTLAITESEHGYLTYKEWDKILIVAALNKQAPLIDGTTTENLPLNKLHWGCRHEFTPVIM